MKKILLLIALLCCCFCYAQDLELDELQDQAAKAKTDLDKVLSLRLLMQYYNADWKADSAKYFLNKIDAIANENSEPAVKTEGANSAGWYWLGIKGKEKEEKFINAQKYFNQALQIAINGRDHIREGWIHLYLSYSWSILLIDEKNKVLNEAEKALNIALES